MSAHYAEMQRSVTLSILPVSGVDSLSDVELAPVLHVLHNDLANDDKSILRSIMERESAIGVARLERVALLSLELIEEVGVAAIHEHDTSLADRFRAELGLEGTGSAIVSVPVREGTAARLAEAGVKAE